MFCIFTFSFKSTLSVSLPSVNKKSIYVKEISQAKTNQHLCLTPLVLILGRGELHEYLLLGLHQCHLGLS